MSGGTSTSRVAQNTCFTVDSPQALLFCDVKPPFQTVIKLNGVVPLPFGAQISAAFQSLPGPEISGATYSATRAEIQPTLGRGLASGGATVVLPLLQSGTLFGDQYQKLDLRLSKIFRVGRYRMTGSLDMFNALNGAGILDVNRRFGTAFANPVRVLGARFLRISGQFDF